MLRYPPPPLLECINLFLAIKFWSVGVNTLIGIVCFRAYFYAENVMPESNVSIILPQQEFLQPVINNEGWSYVGMGLALKRRENPQSCLPLSCCRVCLVASHSCSLSSLVCVKNFSRNHYQYHVKWDCHHCILNYCCLT